MPDTTPVRSDQPENLAKLLPGRSVPLCSHIMTSGSTCGSPAVSGTPLCYHHSTVKTALARAATASNIPFVFPEDSAALQINNFLLLQAFTNGRIDLRTFNSMQRMLRLMATTLGKMSLADNHAPAAKMPAAVKASEPMPAKQPIVKTAPHQVASNPNPQPVRSKSVSNSYPSFEQIAAQLKPIGAECFLNIPSLSNSLTNFPLTR